MAGNQSRGLIEASKTRGWDPTVIPGRDGEPARSIAGFDIDPGNLMGRPVGDLPGGTPDGWPDQWDNGRMIPGDRPGAVSFSLPDASREYGNEHAPDNLGQSKFDNRGRVTPPSIPQRVEDTRSMFDTPWNTADFERDRTERKTTNANPYPGMPGSR